MMNKLIRWPVAVMMLTLVLILPGQPAAAKNPVYKLVKETSYDAADNLLEVKEYQYDKTGHDMGFVQYDEEKNTISSSVVVWEKNYTRKHVDILDEKDAIITSEDSVLDDKGQLKKTTTANSDKTFISTTEYKYDKKGRLVKEIMTAKDLADKKPHKTSSKVIYNYDKDGRLMNKEQIDEKKSTYYAEYEYDTDGNLVSVTSYAGKGGVKETELAYTYEKENGVFLPKTESEYKCSTYDEEKKQVELEHPELLTESSYDENGNMIEKKSINDGKTDIVTMYDYKEY